MFTSDNMKPVYFYNLCLRRIIKRIIDYQNCCQLIFCQSTNCCSSRQKGLKMLAFNFFRLLTWTTYTSSLPLYQISNFFTSPLTFSVIPTAVICRETYTVYTDTRARSIRMSSTSDIRLTSCNTSVLSVHKHSHSHTHLRCVTASSPHPQ